MQLKVGILKYVTTHGPSSNAALQSQQVFLNKAQLIFGKAELHDSSVEYVWVTAKESKEYLGGHHGTLLTHLM